MATALRREREWLDYVAGLLNDPLVDWPDASVGRLLNETFGGPACAYYSRSPDGRLEQRQWPPEHFASYHAEIAYFTEYDAPTRHPILRYYLATGDQRCLQTVDVPREVVDDRVQAGWVELARSWSDGIESQLAIPLVMGPSGHRAFIVGRADPFRAQELRLSALLQRLLVGLDGQITAYSRWARRSGPVAAEVAEAVRLTQRELAVLDLLASGLTAAAMARRLGITERTVQKHLQRCYAKLGVADRLDAVLRAQRIGLLGT